MKRYWYTRGSFIEEDNGEVMLASEVLPELDRMNARIAELETWHPASEPPEHNNFIALLLRDNDNGEYLWEKALYTNGLRSGVPMYEYRFAHCNVPVEGTKFTAIGWHDVPQMSERTES